MRSYAGKAAHIEVPSVRGRNGEIGQRLGQPAMNPAFLAHSPLVLSTRGTRSSGDFRRRIPAACQSAASDNLYKVLGLAPPKNGAAPSLSEIRRAYLDIAKTEHPDVSPSSGADGRFASVSHAWAVLGDPVLRRVYDTSGEEGLAAIKSIDERTADLRKRFAGLDGDSLDYLADSGQLVGGLLSPAEDPAPASLDGSSSPFSFGEDSRDDACPRSVEEAIWNIQFHEDMSVRYYGLWWIYKFKVVEAEDALVNVLQTSSEQTALGGFGIRRRAALALGAVATPPTASNVAAVLALTESMKSSDYFLRYRAAEALANVAQRAALSRNSIATFPPVVVQELKEILKRGQRQFEKKEAAKTGYQRQESLFDLDKLNPEVREQLEKIFQDRRVNEQRSRRTTMTPQLGVDEVGSEADEPFEWVLKAVAAICSQSTDSDEELLATLRSYTRYPVPLVRYAAHKALYALTNDSMHAEEIVEALHYGVEHHYSQRVLIRDLGDLGYCQGAAAVASCPMVENSFKILALKNMLGKRDHDPAHPDVRNVLAHMDALL